MLLAPAEVSMMDREDWPAMSVREWPRLDKDYVPCLAFTGEQQGTETISPPDG